MPADLAVRMRQAAQRVGEEAEVHPDPRHDAAPVRPQQRPVVAGFHHREFLCALVDAVRHAVQDVGALVAGHGRPASEGLLRRGNCLGHLRRSARRHLSHRLLVDGGDVGEGPCGRDASAADPVPGVDRDTFRDRRIRHVL